MASDSYVEKKEEIIPTLVETSKANFLVRKFLAMSHVEDKSSVHRSYRFSLAKFPFLAEQNRFQF
jgi:hypothetical protein